MLPFYSSRRKIWENGNASRTKGKSCLAIGKYRPGYYRKFYVQSSDVNVGFDVCFVSRKMTTTEEEIVYI